MLRLPKRELPIPTPPTSFDAARGASSKILTRAIEEFLKVRDQCPESHEYYMLVSVFWVGPANVIFSEFRLPLEEPSKAAFALTSETLYFRRFPQPNTILQRRNRYFFPFHQNRESLEH